MSFIEKFIGKILSKNDLVKTAYIARLENQKDLKEKVNKAIKDMKKDGTLTKISEKFFAGQDVTKKTKVDYTEIDISDVE